jgi:hypothetical protein
MHPFIIGSEMLRIILAGVLAVSAALASGNNYKNFDVAIYSRVYETKQMKDPAWLESHWEAISRNMKVDKIYLETHRDMVVVDQETLDVAKKFFLSKGVKVSGGITAPSTSATCSRPTATPIPPCARR